MDRNYNIDIKLLKKYDTAGPRYTSYPTAPYFHSGITSKQYIKEVITRNKENKRGSISLYFHIPFCDSMCYFCGCNMLITKSAEFVERYIDFLIREMDLILHYWGRKKSIGQMHWGGGSPNTLSPEQIERLGKAIKKRFEFDQDAEIAVEIDPRGLTFEHMQAFKNAGFNRFSMGIQDFNQKVQKAINRIQPEDITRNAFKWGRTLGYESINIDLIYGLPYQNPRNFSFTLDKVIEMNPDRIAVFNFAYIPEMIKRQRIIDPNTLPAGEVKLELLKMTIDRLTGAGYIYIGMDHFARPEDELFQALKNRTLYRNFQGYSTHAGLDLYAFGMSAISQLPNIYVQNHKTMRMYYQQLKQGVIPVMRGYILSEDDILRRNVIMNLMCHFHLSKREIEERYKINFDQYFMNELNDFSMFIEDRLLQVSDNEIIVNETGRVVIRNIAMIFDAFLRKNKIKKHRFSKTI
jgi:oxygen-independent coproporphyrinogen-3 oxidase